MLLYGVEFEWDPGKNTSNKEKHNLSFEEASKLFTSGATYLEEADLDHIEPRFRALGPIAAGIIVVIFVERLDGDVLRIISARYATRGEVLRYQQAMEKQ